MSSRRGDQFSAVGDDGGGIGPMTTHLTSQKVDFSTDSHDGRLCTSSIHSIASPVASSCIMYIQFILLMVIHLVFLMVMVKVVWVIVSSNFPPRNFIFLPDGANFVPPLSREYPFHKIHVLFLIKSEDLGLI